MIQMRAQQSPRLTQTGNIYVEPHVVQVVIVEAHLLICEALQHIVETFPHVRVSARLNQLHDGLEVLKRREEDVLILGSSVSASDCLECIQIMQRMRTSPGIVVIQRQLRPETVFPIISGGVQSLLGEDASAEDLARAITAAATGSTFLSQRARKILNEYVSSAPLHLTQREIQVVQHLRRGLSNNDIAQRLNLKEKSVEKHLTHIYEKLQVRSRTEAILRVQRLHI